MNSYNKVSEMIEEWKAQSISKDYLCVNAAEAMVGWPYAWGATGQKCTVANREARMKNSKIGQGDINLIKKHCQILSSKSSACSGCKYYPNDETVNIHDCIGFVNKLLDIAGIEHYGAGCSIMWNHSKNWVEKGKIASIPDKVCLVFQQKKGEENKMDHIGLYLGNGYVIHCSVEVKKQKLSEYPWTHFAVPVGMYDDYEPTKATIKKGSKGELVVLAQTMLIQLGYDLAPYGADGNFGTKTQNAVKEFQASKGLTTDGIVGRATWKALEEATKGDPEPEPQTELYTATIRHLTKDLADKLAKEYAGCEISKE